ncbi:MAG: hypothetical protein ABSF65_11150 [Candidatus Bathyarchaeia archaeon]
MKSGRIIQVGNSGTVDVGEKVTVEKSGTVAVWIGLQSLTLPRTS